MRALTTISTTWGPISLLVSDCGLKKSTLPGQELGEIAGTPEPTVCHWRESWVYSYSVWLMRYLDRDFPEILPPLHPSPTSFSQAVRKVLITIPPGEVISYGEVARRVGVPQGARAVGQVVARNPVPLFVPCHRVISADGSLGGFGGGRALKRRLLNHERRGG